MLELDLLEEGFLFFQMVFGKSTVFVTQYSLVEGSFLVRIDILHTLKAFQLNQLLELHGLRAHNGQVGLVEADKESVLVRADGIDFDVAVVEMIIESYLPEAELAGDCLEGEVVVVEQVVRAVVEAAFFEVQALGSVPVW